jgi:phage shock protein E
MCRIGSLNFKTMKATIISIVLAAFIFGCTQSSSNDEELVDVTTFEQMINDNDDEIILDVRTPEEFAEGHIPGAVLINIYDEDFKSKVNALDKSKEVMVYCAAGVRSEKASAILKESGFTKVYHLKDGVKAWNEAQKELIK